MTDQHPQQLSRSLSLGGATAISTGLAFAAINFLGIAQLLHFVDAKLAGLAVLVGGVIVLAVRGLFAELNGAWPSAAGIRVWLQRSMNDRLALIITLTYMSAIVLVIAADAVIIGEAAGYVFHNGRLVAMGYVVLLLAVATWLNLRGIRLAGAAEKLVTTITVVLTVAVGVVILVKGGTHAIAAAPPATNSSLIQAVILGVFVYTGFEWVTTNAEEVESPKIIPRAMLISVFVLAVSQAVFVVATGITIGGVELDNAYPQLLVAQQALGQVGLVVMVSITALTAVNTFNGGFVTLSRFIYAVAREGKLPRPLAQLNDRAAPVLPIWILGGSSLVLALVVALTDSFAVMVSVGAALEMMIYAAAGFAVWRLRRTQPEQPRTFRFWGGGRLAGVLMVVFGLMAVAASLSVGGKTTPLPLILILIFAGLVAVYVYGYLPRMERREEAERAARRAARQTARAARAERSVSAPTAATSDSAGGVTGLGR